jgi:PhoPQ-activated pathogenicity-related protein
MEKYKESGREEDELITYTWDKFMKTGDETWPARLPMTKSAVRAMDTITLFLGSEEGGGLPIDSFYVAGGSKRGWTTWTTAAVDPRVIAISPIVSTCSISKIVRALLLRLWPLAEAVGNYERWV